MKWKRKFVIEVNYQERGNVVYRKVINGFSAEIYLNGNAKVVSMKEEKKFEVTTPLVDINAKTINELYALVDSYLATELKKEFKLIPT